MYNMKIDGVSVSCDIIRVYEDDKRMAEVRVGGETHHVLLYKLAMQTSLCRRMPFEEIVNEIYDKFGTGI